MVIRPGDEAGEGCERIGNFTFGLLKKTDEGKVVSADPPEDTLRGKPPVSASRLEYIERFAENDLTICEEETEDEGKIDFAKGHYPLIGYLGGNKVLIWNVGSPESACRTRQSGKAILSTNTGHFEPFKEAIMEFDGLNVQLDGVPALTSGASVWDAGFECPDRVPPTYLGPQHPVTTYDPNDFKTNEDWTGDINDYKAVIWHQPVSSNTFFFDDMCPFSGTALDNDARWVPSPTPLWWNQILEEGYEGTVILIGSSNCLFPPKCEWCFVNSYINELAAKIGSNQRIMTDVRSWGDNAAIGFSNFQTPFGTWSAHPLGAGVPTFPHINSAPVTGGQILAISGDPEYRLDWCDINTPSVFIPQIAGVERLVINKRAFYFIVFGTQYFSLIGYPPATFQDHINKVNFIKNLVTVKVPQPA